MAVLAVTATHNKKFSEHVHLIYSTYLFGRSFFAAVLRQRFAIPNLH